ncbi:hypothetical protein D9V69_00375 [Buchnera aphidicola (Hyadaphis tataricae)]|uniref:Flagellar hook-length control protein-like C-terminal domain-containing protein n=1 Tax=Buchnera aphidicola (Hyadaphis tataricae) TaxID=1241859 RepID=A0A4D6Y621_9GAMM|nr:flagellar hook-length control protein FliK [Buchnera aphidicola]QCI21400.1 hypothetical protein D9V69_00375 [Buchnera aphidicola (Hyadaphis tataricae)]
MLKIIGDIAIHKNNFSHGYAKHHKLSIETLKLYQCIYDELNQKSINNKIEFDNIVTEEKKHDKNMFYTNLIMSHLLNILNKKEDNIKSDHSNDFQNSIPKTTLDHMNTVLSDDIVNLKTQKNQIKSSEQKLSKLAQDLFNGKFDHCKKNFFKKNKLINDINLKKSYSLELNNHYSNKIIFPNINDSKNDKHTLQNKTYLNIAKYDKNHKNEVFFYHSKNKNKNIIHFIDSARSCSKNKSLKFKVNQSLNENSTNSIKWKKNIVNKILLSLDNKRHQADIYFKPKQLGDIYIKINMNDDYAVLNLFSNQKEVRNFLDDHVYLLRNSLIKKGIKLRKINILNVLKDKFQHNTRIFNCNQFHKILNSNKIKTVINNQTVDVYV